MSRVNKANRDRYVQAGRLTPDEMAREREKQTPRLSERVRNRAGDRAPRPSAAPAAIRRRTAREE